MTDGKSESQKRTVRWVAVAAAVVVPFALVLLFWRMTPYVGGWGQHPSATAPAVATEDVARNGRMPVSGSDAMNPEVLFRQNCASCHGADMRGTGTVPSLKRPGWPYTDNRDSLVKIIHQGRGLTMPSFEGRLSNAQIEALADWLEAQNAPGK
jgi:cytochrome c551